MKSVRSHTGSRLRWLVLAAASLVCLRASAEGGVGPPGPPWSIYRHTDRSTSGNFVLSITADNCAELAAAVELRAGDGSVIPLRTQELGPCVYAFLPPSPLAEGEYCYAVVSDFQGYDTTGGCFAVTGVQAPIASAKLTVQLENQWVEEVQCEACPLSYGEREGCTRERQRFFARVQLQGVNELGSTHLASWAVANGRPESTPPLPENATWGPFHGWVGEAVPLSTLEGGFACLALYARPLEGGNATLVGHACLDLPAQDTLPASYNPSREACPDDYRGRWCADNRSDCQHAERSRLLECLDYPFYCTADGQARTTVSEQLPHASADASVDASIDGEPVRSSSGCSAGRDVSRGWLWLLVLVLFGWNFRRVRRNRS
jgi:hypothetical protein